MGGGGLEGGSGWERWEEEEGVGKERERKKKGVISSFYYLFHSIPFKPNITWNENFHSILCQPNAKKFPFHSIQDSIPLIIPFLQKNSAEPNGPLIFISTSHVGGSHKGFEQQLVTTERRFEQQLVTTWRSQCKTMTPLPVVRNELPAGRSLLGGLNSHSFGSLRSSMEEMACSDLFTQQIRTFIQMGTKLKVVDSSGAKTVMCIQALKGKKGARLGDTIVASVKEVKPGSKVKKGEVVRGVVVRAAMPKGRCDGSEVRYDDNAVVLLNKQGEPIGTRVSGPVPHELRKKKHVKILSLAEHVA